MGIARDWDGATYDLVSAPMEMLGREVLARLDLRGDEVVLDAGCGSGRITAALLERVPGGRVIAVDGAPSMIEAARARLGERPNLELLVADLCALDIGGRRVDAVLSTATFHWIDDHATLFARLRGALRDGGVMAAQCGGNGNIEGIHAAADTVGRSDPFAAHLAGWRGPWRFARASETEDLLRAAGFTTARCRLEQRPVTTDDPVNYYRNIILGAHLGQLPVALRDAFVEAVLGRLPEPSVIPYVRLNIDATA